MLTVISGAARQNGAYDRYLTKWAKGGEAVTRDKRVPKIHSWAQMRNKGKNSSSSEVAVRTATLSDIVNAHQ
jgi:hypothetical protein